MYETTEPSVLFHSLHHAFKRQAAAEQKARGVEELGSPLILLCLFHMDRDGQKPSQRELARRLRLSPATMAVSLRTMERCGYVNREQDEKDQRRNRVSITEKGRDAVERCGAAFRATDERLLAGFSPGEKEQLTGFFIRMLRNLGVTDLEKERPPFQPPPCAETKQETECDSQW